MERRRTTSQAQRAGITMSDHRSVTAMGRLFWACFFAAIVLGIIAVSVNA